MYGPSNVLRIPAGSDYVSVIVTYLHLYTRPWRKWQARVGEKYRRASFTHQPRSTPSRSSVPLMRLPWETRLLLDIRLLRLRDASEYLPVYYIANGYRGVFDDP